MTRRDSANNDPMLLAFYGLALFAIAATMIWLAAARW
jgi:hypothetical protein